MISLVVMPLVVVVLIFKAVFSLRRGDFYRSVALAGLVGVLVSMRAAHSAFEHFDDGDFFFCCALSLLFLAVYVYAVCNAHCDSSVKVVCP